MDLRDTHASVRIVYHVYKRALAGEASFPHISTHRGPRKTIQAINFFSREDRWYLRSRETFASWLVGQKNLPDLVLHLLRDQCLVDG